LRQTNRNVGVAIGTPHLADPTYVATAGKQFSQLTPENEMKWEFIEPEPGVFDFSGADQIVEYAIANDMHVRGHTLVWYSQLPDWVNQLTGADAVRAAMTNHIQTVVRHFRDKYPGTVFSWDVVNEAIDTMGQTAIYRDNVFYREIGQSYIAEAFQIAHDTDPDALLFYNDYGIEGMFGAKPAMAFSMVSDLVNAGVPINGIGLQMHTGPDDRGPGFAEYQGNIARYAALGLQIDVTEMDVTLCGYGNNSFALEAQRFRYNRIVSACFDSPACRSISLWGLGDANSWLNDNGCQANGMPVAGVSPEPLAFDDNYARKPAWWGVYDGLIGCGYQ
jgi:endo-1,4-beta-xylanase